MRIQANRYLEAAKKEGIDPFILDGGTGENVSISVTNGEVESQEIGTIAKLTGIGLYQGKRGVFTIDSIRGDNVSFMMDSLKESALYGKEYEENNFYNKGERCSPCKSALKDFKPATIKELKDFALELCEEVKKRDERLKEVSIDLSMSLDDCFAYSSFGFKRKLQKKYFYGSISVVAIDEEGEPRSGGITFKSMKNLEDFKAEGRKVIDKAIHSAVDFFKSRAIKSKMYNVVIDPDCVSALLSFLMHHFDAKAVQKHLSLFEGKIDQKILSDKLTIRHTPHAVSINAQAYDDDLAPTKDFDLIKKGVLKDYFYSVETANKENRETNGCSGGNGTGQPILLTVKPGKYSLKDLFKKMKNGVYITTVSGLNSGIDSQTLNFSLPISGYQVKDGKIEKAFSMSILAGNLKDLFENITAVGSNSEEHGIVIAPSLLVKKLSISGDK